MRIGARDTFKFSLLVGLSAIFIDAAVAHGLFWENDPYWTYWITKTFLIITIFNIGTAFLGIGFWQGFLITAVHTIALEIYYDIFAPVGLPQEPMWLPFRDLWTTGVPAHYLAILAGYLIALFIWRRSQTGRGTIRDDLNPRQAALFSLGTALLVLILDGLITHGLLFRRFPGFTYFIQHLLIAYVFLFAWTVYVGLDLAGILTGSVMLSLMWTAYSMYLGPVGLPSSPPRYLGYDDLWLRSFPGGLISVLIGLWLGASFISHWLAIRVTPVKQRSEAA